MKKILVTTTDSLSGWEIETYLKPVFASVVIGTNVFADFGASVTDFFGGRSSGYEKRLQLIKENAIAMLNSKASELGANCILGLKVDVDEISGKNMQMFMVTAAGMAVIAKNAKTQTDPKHSKEIDKDHVREKAYIIKLAKKFKDFNAELKPEELKAIIESKSGEFKEFIVAKLKALGPVSDVEVIKLYKEYFAGIEPNDAIASLYPALLAETGESFTKAIITIIKETDLVDYGYIYALLGDTLPKKKMALSILTAFKPSYNHDDIQSTEEMIEQLNVSFPVIATITTKKGFLSSAEKDVWVCASDNTANPIEAKLCSSCYNNRHGFSDTELQPGQVIEALNNRLLALKSLL